MILFLQLYLAHLVAAFIVPRMFPGVVVALGLKGLINRAASRVLLMLLAINISLNSRDLIALLALSLALALIDVITQRLVDDDWRPFAIVQVVETVVIAAAWKVLRPDTSTEIEALLTRPQTYLILVTYVAVVFAGGEAVRRVCLAFLPTGSKKVGLEKAGEFIGRIERFLILTFVFSNNGEAIGFLIAAKTLVRFPEIKEPDGHFAEYYLVGTLTSVGIALSIAALVGLLI